MRVEKSELDGVLLIRPTEAFTDHRGEFVETYNQREYENAGIRQQFVQDDISISKKHVLRGIHGDGTTWKLVQCMVGAVYLVVINNDPSSEQYRQWQAFELNKKNRIQVRIPPNFGNGHLVLSDEAIFHYKQSSYYDRESQFSLRWNDPVLGVTWPITDPILSERDRQAPLLAE